MINRLKITRWTSWLSAPYLLLGFAGHAIGFLHFTPPLRMPNPIRYHGAGRSRRARGVESTKIASVAWSPQLPSSSGSLGDVRCLAQSPVRLAARRALVGTKCSAIGCRRCASLLHGRGTMPERVELYRRCAEKCFQAANRLALSGCVQQQPEPRGAAHGR
jgi:hypothetical protein